MGATSVTGVGLGSADKKQKGSEHLRVGAEKIIGPRVVWADNVSLDGSGDATIKLPVLPGVTADYVVFATHQDTTTAAAISATVTVGASDTTVVVKGAANDGASVMIVKAGLAI